MTRVLILLVAALFIVGFAFLTLSTISAQGGISLGTGISVLVVVLMGIGILGALLNPPRR
jgi:glycerol uptake facilitator-like aquaporin